MNENITDLIAKQVKHANDEMNKRRNNDYNSFIKDLYLRSSIHYKGQPLTVTDAYCENEYRDTGMKVGINSYEFVQNYRHIWYIVLSFSLKSKVTLKYSQYLDMTYGYEYLDVETRYKLELAYKEFINETAYSDDK